MYHTNKNCQKTEIFFFYFVPEANPEEGKMYLIETAEEQISLKSGY